MAQLGIYGQIDGMTSSSINGPGSSARILSNSQSAVPVGSTAVIMSIAVLMDKIKERLTQVDPNNRKVVAIFQIVAGDANWGE